MAEQIKFGDNLYLQGEKLVLDNGVNNGVISSENGTVKIEGNLEISGTTTTVSSETVTFDDNILLLNSNETGTPSQDGGIEIERGTSYNKTLVWSESSDKWTVGAETFVAGTFEGPLTGNVTGNLSGNVTSTGTSAFTTVDINGGNIDSTIIGATTPAAGTFSTITGDGTAITNVLTNYTTTNLTEGTNKYFTDERVDDRIDALFTNAYGISGTYNDAGDVYTLAFDPINAGSAVAILDTTDTTQAKFRTIREGQVGSGGNGDLTVALSGDEIVIDTKEPINVLEYSTFTGNGSTSVYTLPYSVSQDWQALVYISGAIQQPATDYSISGTTITLTSPLPNGTDMNVLKMATTSVYSTITNALTLGGNSPNHYLSWTNFTGTPTTVAGYGITDAYTKTEIDNALAGQDALSEMTGTSDDVTEGSSNLYYTNTRVDARINLHTGNNLDLSSKSTTDLNEGTNLYYTDARADARAQLKIDALVGGASTAFDTLLEIENAMATDSELSSAISAINHDSLSGFVLNEHIDWTQASAGTIHPTNYVTDNSGSIIPAADNTYDLGSTTKKYANIYGHSVHAHYADLAERYASDVPYDKGTVVVLGGDEEITVTSEARDVSVAGVISTNPALKMNADAGDDTTHPYVALRGRVPCKMIGPVSKGDLIVTANEPGYAQSVGKENAGRSVFAKSIETDLTEGKKLIEVVIL
jgi:hypothetical protein